MRTGLKPAQHRRIPVLDVSWPILELLQFTQHFVKEQLELRPKWLNLTLRRVLLVFSDWLMSIEVRNLSQSAFQMVQASLQTFPRICGHFGKAPVTEDRRHVIEYGSHEKQTGHNISMVEA